MSRYAKYDDLLKASRKPDFPYAIRAGDAIRVRQPKDFVPNLSIDEVRSLGQPLETVAHLTVTRDEERRQRIQSDHAAQDAVEGRITMSMQQAIAWEAYRQLVERMAAEGHDRRARPISGIIHASVGGPDGLWT